LEKIGHTGRIDDGKGRTEGRSTTLNVALSGVQHKGRNPLGELVGN